MAARWFVPLRSAPRATLHVLCLPYAGAPLRCYPWLEACIGEDMALWTASLPGRGPRLAEPPPAGVAAMVEALAAELALLADRPYVLFGHSMGALLAFELACAARRRGLPLPVALLVSGAQAPDRFITPRQPPRHGLAKAPFLDYVRSLGGMPAELLAYPELVELVLPALRADFASCERYVHQPEAPLPLPLAALGGSDDPEVAWPALCAWRAHVSGPALLRRFKGDHFFINSGQPEIAAFVSSLLRDCAGGTVPTWNGGAAAVALD